MRSPSPVDRVAGDQANVGLGHDRPGLEGLPRALPAQVAKPVPIFFPRIGTSPRSRACRGSRFLNPMTTRSASAPGATTRTANASELNRRPSPCSQGSRGAGASLRGRQTCRVPLSRQAIQRWYRCTCPLRIVVRGSVKMNTVIPGWSGPSSNSPPWARAISRARLNPSPEPPTRSLRERSAR